MAGGRQGLRLAAQRERAQVSAVFPLRSGSGGSALVFSLWVARGTRGAGAGGAGAAAPGEGSALPPCPGACAEEPVCGVGPSVLLQGGIKSFFVWRCADRRKYTKEVLIVP